MTRQRLGFTALLVLGLSLVVLLAHHWRQADTAFDALRVGQYDRAAKLFAAPAEKGVVKAQLHLGNLHYLGLGVPQDYAKAAHWYERAARKNDARGQYNLALLHHNGFGQVQDEVNSLAWFLLANENGNTRAEAFLRSISGSLNPNRVQLARQTKERLQREINKALQ